MKKILIGLTTLNVGGVASSLLNFINNMKDVVSIDLLLFRDDGDLIDKVPSDIKVIVPKGLMGVFVPDSKQTKKLGTKAYLFRRLMGLNQAIFKKNDKFVKYATKHSEKLSGYDIAIAYGGVVPNGNSWAGVAEYILNNVQASKKFAFTHDGYMTENYQKHSIELYKQFDKIIAVSESCKNQITEYVPELKEKFDYLYNFCNKHTIIENSKEPEKLPETINLVTVSRLSEEKGIKRLLHVIKRLKLENYKFVYHLIGNGGLQQEVEEYIRENELSEYIKLWGYQSNPHKIVVSSDLMILPSYRESFGLVLVESMLCGTPVLATKTISAEEIVGDYGFVCENNVDDLYEALKNILDNPKLLQEKREKLKNYNYDNSKIVEKFLKFCE